MTAQDVRAPPLGPSVGSVEEAILQAVAYADLFEYPLTERELHRFLVGRAASRDEVAAALQRGLLANGKLATSRGYVTLAGRERTVETRLRRQAVSRRMWAKGQRYGRMIGRLPFARMVAVTGTLAVHNVEHDADIDYLIVTVPGRVWLTRFLALFLVRLGQLERVTLCPNYVLSLDALDGFDRSFFVAHELAQMVPVYGAGIHRQILEANQWARLYLPNAFDGSGAPREVDGGWFGAGAKRAGERLLRGRLGDALERRERAIKIDRLNRQAAACGASAACFTAELCKGHLVDHGQAVGEAYAARLRAVGVDPDRALAFARFPAT